MAAVFFLIVLLVFAIAIFGLFAMAEGRRVTWKGEPHSARRHRAHRRAYELSPLRAPRVAASAKAAMQRAGYEAGPEYSQITDIGLLAYRTESEPRLVRLGDIMVDTEYLRPYTELWVPFRSRGPVRFELVDGTGRVRYVDEQRYDLSAGRNSLLPNTWLPLNGKWVDPDQHWQLTVSAGRTVLAVHNFGWQAVGNSELKPFIESDGEISPELQVMLRDSSVQAISLAELLDSETDG